MDDYSTGIDPLVEAYIAGIATAIHNVLSSLWISALAYSKRTETLAQEHVLEGLAQVGGWAPDEFKENLGPSLSETLMVRNEGELASFNKLTFLEFGQKASRQLQRSRRQTITKFRSLSWTDLAETCLRRISKLPEVRTSEFFQERTPTEQLAFLRARVSDSIMTRITMTATREKYIPAPRHRRPRPPMSPLSGGRGSVKDGGDSPPSLNGMNLLPTLQTHITAADSASQVAGRLAAEEEEEAVELAAAAPAPAPAPAPASAPAPAPVDDGFEFDGIVPTALSHTGSAQGSMRVAANVSTLDAGTVLTAHPILRA